MPAKSIVAINASIPIVEHYLDYEGKGSLRDYDIAIFNPRFPYQNRIEFSGGGSCISIEGTKTLSDAITHWNRELGAALAAGKTVFVILGDLNIDRGATGTTMKSRTERTYQLANISNYSALPAKLKVGNSRGQSVVVKDGSYRALYEAIKEIAEYRVVFEDLVGIRPIFTARDGTVIGGAATLKDQPGRMILLPFFDFYQEKFLGTGDGGEQIWNDEAMQAARAFVGQVVAIDKMLRGASESTPAPDWTASVAVPRVVTEIDIRLEAIDREISDMSRVRGEEERRKSEALMYSQLLYETGKPLEVAVEKALELLGYTVGTLHIGDVEIDHVIVGPSGKRMIGETEGRDNNAIDITKFRQLESNIGEDFEREEVNVPAKGILFGNGYRLFPPEGRLDQFTQKSITNSHRLRCALIQTADLYPVVLHLLDNPADEPFREACRDVIERTEGGIVVFPSAK